MCVASRAGVNRCQQASDAGANQAGGATANESPADQPNPAQCGSCAAIHLGVQVLGLGNQLLQFKITPQSHEAPV
jgi:hypothetical protein